MVIIEILIFLSTILPVFHLVNSLVSKRKSLKRTDNIKKFSILVPCYNEEDVISVCIVGLLAMDYTEYDAVFINDGSTDRTFDVLYNELDLCPIVDRKLSGAKGIYRSNKFKNFFMIDKVNGGKSSALNLGIDFVRTELVVTMDADSVLHRDALWHMNRVFEDENIVAAGGSVHIMQGYDAEFNEKKSQWTKKTIILLQILEYLKGFYIYKMSLSAQSALAIISGAFGVFRRDILLIAGGYRETLGEDIDITMHIQQIIHKTKNKIVYIPEALCYTQCPENWHDLINQRIRWQKGFIECVCHYKWFLLKTFLYKSLSFHFLVEAMAVGICSCVFTVFTYIFAIALAFIDIRTLIVFSLYYVFCIVFNVLYTAGALKEASKYNTYPVGIMKHIPTTILMDLLFYRYFNLAVYIAGTAAYFWSRDKKNNWNKVQRFRRELFIPVVSEEHNG